MDEMMIPEFDLNTVEGRAALEQCSKRLRDTTSAGGDAARTVAQIIDAVRDEGDDAVVRYMRQWTDPQFSADDICVSCEQMQQAADSLDGELREAIEASIENVRRYQEHIMPVEPEAVTIDGAELSLRFTPMDSVGLAVPGGAAVLFSTVIMLAVPAQVAGVDPENISVINPPPTRKGDETAGEIPGDISPVVLATCHMLGIKKVYRIGGAQAIAALALGTEQVDKVDMIAGPGNVYVQLAKAQLAGAIGTDGFYGPSEIVVIADESADPRCVAADLIAQAEHDPGKCFLVAWSADVIERIGNELAEQLKRRTRVDAINRALQDESAAILVADENQAAAVANTIAAEHVNLAVADPEQWLKRVRHGGEFFLGDQTPVASGDYYAGPSHCLPTGTTARFASGISVYTFLKRSGTVGYPNGMSATTIDRIARLAEAEGLDGHADSVRVRGE